MRGEWISRTAWASRATSWPSGQLNGWFSIGTSRPACGRCRLKPRETHASAASAARCWPRPRRGSSRGGRGSSRRGERRPSARRVRRPACPRRGTCPDTRGGGRGRETMDRCDIQTRRGSNRRPCRPGSLGPAPRRLSADAARCDNTEKTCSRQTSTLGGSGRSETRIRMVLSQPMQARPGSVEGGLREPV